MDIRMPTFECLRMPTFQCLRMPTFECRPLKAFESANFSHTSEDMKNLKNSSKSNKVVKAMVDKVKVKSVVVNWQCRAYAKDSALSDLNEKQPESIVEGSDLERLKMLNVFEPCTLQIGDR